MIQARDGFGNPVDWFAVIKLPQKTFSAANIDKLNLGIKSATGLNASNIHCTCPDPQCQGLKYDYGKGRGSGLCYLYADSNNSTLRFFRDIFQEGENDDITTLDCLGQGGNDPISHTLQQLNSPENYNAPNVEWAYWNDEFNRLADSYDEYICRYNSNSDEAIPYKHCSGIDDTSCGKRCSPNTNTIATIKSWKDAYKPCSYDSECNNFTIALQSNNSTTTRGKCQQIPCTKVKALPHYNTLCNAPHAHSKGALGYKNNSTGFFLQASTPNFPDPSYGPTKFVPLGCQLRDNTMVAQHFFAVTVTSETMQTHLAPQLARDVSLCGPFSMSCLNESKPGHVHYGWNCASEQTMNQPWSIIHKIFSEQDKNNDHQNPRQLSLLHSNNQEQRRKNHNPIKSTFPTYPRNISIHLVTHTSLENMVPPWLVVAQQLQVDLAVASWIDGSEGFASICKGDNFSQSTNQMCLTDDAIGLHLNPDGGSPYSIENILAASVHIPGRGERAWGLWGGPSPIATHTKLALASITNFSKDKQYVIFGDENNQGWPCSKTCSGSQSNRGGIFLALEDPQLHNSMKSLIKMVCSCNSDSISSRRFCGFGCWKKNTSAWMPNPPQYKQNLSFWDHVAWTGPKIQQPSIVQAQSTAPSLFNSYASMIFLYHIDKHFISCGFVIICVLCLLLYVSKSLFFMTNRAKYESVM